LGIPAFAATAPKRGAGVLKCQAGRDTAAVLDALRLSPDDRELILHGHDAKRGIRSPFTDVA